MFYKFKKNEPPYLDDILAIADQGYRKDETLFTQARRWVLHIPDQIFTGPPNPYLAESYQEGLILEQSKSPKARIKLS